ncbi:hypothetical protein GCK72_023309 [Caenorhabditis remanei]|uniref:Uncharacterized protein n=1 Tax=Caenorhabditis remanei TaxID=31234 RepID=A0A6A5FWL7_CAERE|nr:hypothetical protein GCK72_023309 [Caenorhabditis remanei]KAF1746851.1 hypothetical protein GCK72_023309 [Caenorhabditis remanei]
MKGSHREPRELMRRWAGVAAFELEALVHHGQGELGLGVASLSWHVAESLLTSAMPNQQAFLQHTHGMPASSCGVHTFGMMDEAASARRGEALPTTPIGAEKLLPFLGGA